MDKKLILELNYHNVYYVKTDVINYYITIPKNIEKTNICIELKSKMSNYDMELNDEIWVMENIKTTFSYIDTYNITLILPILKEEKISILEKIDNTKFEQIDKSLNKKTQGSGIGLPLVKLLVGLHSGYIELDSEEGQGSEFRIYLPDCTKKEISENVISEKYDILEERVSTELSDIYVT